MRNILFICPLLVPSLVLGQGQPKAITTYKGTSVFDSGLIVPLDRAKPLYVTQPTGLLRLNTTLPTPALQVYYGGSFHSVGGGGGGSSIYEGVSPTNVTVGALASGTNIYGMEVADIIQAMTVTYLSPYFSSVNISGVSTQVEVGTSITGSKSFSWTFANGSNVAANTLDIVDLTSSTTLATNISTTSPTSRTVSATHSTETTHTWRISADNTNAVTFTADYTTYWQYSRYWGASSTSSPTNLEILANSELSTTRAKGPFNITVSGSKYPFYIYPSSRGALTSLTIGGFQAINSFNVSTISVTNAQGVTSFYTMYIAKDPVLSTVNDIIAQ